ncbi:hypothetical protein OGAPHI_004116 [Ogataea philodendri]|uniref:Uncharacterized protein n=1 Tax=Ogataea philodendri TaxID=1378263 RepID=A0A9P8P625_9ASCO|nr:uncharacterized protein OGAPHI_004116 [Ogataea philodendri]KAH3665927.1 hypothetical protein OGAPHI_004116 [Ogataea philodendri]
MSPRTASVTTCSIFQVEVYPWSNSCCTKVADSIIEALTFGSRSSLLSKLLIRSTPEFRLFRMVSLSIDEFGLAKSFSLKYTARESSCLETVTLLNSMFWTLSWTMSRKSRDRYDSTGGTVSKSVADGKKHSSA